MAFPEKLTVDALKKSWTDKYVRVKPDCRPELKRFEGRVGRVVTVNYGGRAIVDFADGGWYDFAEFEKQLEEVTDLTEQKKYDPTANSAQKTPTRQG
jgi:hypothetical protein